MAALKDTSPVAILGRKHPLLSQEIEKYSKKWSKRTGKAQSPWPSDGTFDHEQCVEMEVLIKNYKIKDKSAKRLCKREREVAMLKLFTDQAQLLREKTAEYVKKQIERRKEERKKGESLKAEPPSYAAQMPVREIRLLGDYSLRSGKSGKSIYPIDELKKVRERGRELDDIEDLPATYAKAVQLAGKDTRRISGLHDKIMHDIKQSECAEDGSEGEEQGEEEGATGESERVRRSLAEVQYSKLPDPSMVSTPRYLQAGAKPKQARIKEKMPRSESFAPGSEVVEEHGQMEGVITLSSKGHPVSAEVVEEASEYPLLAKGANLQYVPWPTMDLEGLVQRLPCLHDGAGKWVAAFEEETIATILAVGDLKALLGKVLGKQEMEETLRSAQMNAYAGTQAHDGELFNRHRNALWTALRLRYPTRIQPDSIVAVPIKDDESPQAYVHLTRKEWIRQTGGRPDEDIFHRQALRKRIVDGLPLPAQSKLGDAVGLYTMPFEQFTDHVIDAVTKIRSAALRQKQQDEETVRKLTQQQLTEGRKKIQAVVQPVTAAGHAPPPTITAPPAVQPQVIYVQSGGWRGGPPRMRGGATVGRARVMWGNQESEVRCFRCGRVGHMRRQCYGSVRQIPQGAPRQMGPTSPWQGPPAGY
ncbi:uncharacterized protein LOC114868451 isoform X1 [Betta splendens]|uniref:Uncharacterized protein LOC114868451 isoform X1 n=1 Tax=Betta splendens TaxID=158456 RepID=A0A6P7LBG0_BETSP|nr:uncharacterized protein LOC114868451 isoform X1 [Betta splendens]